jgi:hypothetical protein
MASDYGAAAGDLPGLIESGSRGGMLWFLRAMVRAEVRPGVTFHWEGGEHPVSMEEGFRSP